MFVHTNPPHMISAVTVYCNLLTTYSLLQLQYKFEKKINFQISELIKSVFYQQEISSNSSIQIKRMFARLISNVSFLEHNQPLHPAFRNPVLMRIYTNFWLAVD